MPLPSNTVSQSCRKTVLIAVNGGHSKVQIARTIVQTISSNHTLNDNNLTQTRMLFSSMADFRRHRGDWRLMEKIDSGRWPSRKPRIVWTYTTIQKDPNSDREAIETEVKAAERQLIAEYDTWKSPQRKYLRGEISIPVRQPRGKYVMR